MSALSRPIIHFVMGMTNSGKSAFMDAVRPLPGTHLIEVGRALRAKYPPEYFKGQDNPTHTAIEAWRILEDGLREARTLGKSLIFCDGQPRDVKQAQDSLKFLEHFDLQYLVLCAPREVRLQRAISRDGDGLSEDDRLRILAGETPAYTPPKLHLSLKRMESDYRTNYETLAALGRMGVHPTWIDTTSATPAELAQRVFDGSSFKYRGPDQE